MALKITVLSEQRVQLGSRASIVFGVGGGSIGRAHDNDWVLPDPMRYLSAHHARVRFVDGAFHLADTSTNGVFVNGAHEALGRRSTHVLQDGDRLRLGDYELFINIDSDRAESPEASAVFAVTPAPASDPEGDLGASLEMEDLLSPDSAAPTEDPALLAFDRNAPGERTRVLSRPSARGDAHAGDAASAMTMFCRGAGMNAALLAPESHAQLMRLAGLMLREALVGLKGLALAQRELRDRQQIEVGREDPQSIGLTGLPVEDLMLRLFQGHDAHQLDAVQWVRETLASTRRHDQAVARAMRAALSEFLPRLDPKALLPGTTSKPADDAGLAAMTERFRSITEMGSGELPLLFREAFARHFAAEFKAGGSGG